MSRSGGDDLGATVGEFLRREREQIDQALAGLADDLTRPLDPSLREPLRYALSTSGKRLRPILFLAAYRAALVESQAGTRPEAYRLSCAVEIVHTYSLVHDDLPCMDDDDLRRGRPTVHRVYGVATAIVVGAALLPLAVEVVESESAALGIPLQRRAHLVRELCRAAGAEGMVGGQLSDLQAESREVDAGTLERIHRAKTGSLLRGALRLGALAAGGVPPMVDALTRYGEALGLAFQITDDILDVVGDAASLGKPPGRDRDLRKASYPALHGLEGARALARRTADEAIEALTGFDSPELLGLADYVVERMR